MASRACLPNLLLQGASFSRCACVWWSLWLVGVFGGFIPVPDARSQDLNWSADVGAVGAPGSSSYDAPSQMYQISGAGTGLSGTADAFHFAYYQTVCGDGQILVRLVGADATAQPALVLRQSLDPSSAFAAVGLTGSGVGFVRRTGGGSTACADGNTALSTPCWFKLVRSGSLITASVSADGQNWTSVGSDTVDLGSSTLYAGLAVSNGVANAASTAAASFDSEQATFLPAAGLQLWLKADAGLVQDPSGDVSRWADQSGSGNDAQQGSASQQPVVVTGAVNGYPVVHFNGSDSLNFPDHFLDAAAGGELLLVLRSPVTAGGLDGLMTLGLGDGDWAPFSDGTFYESFGSTQRYGPFPVAGNLNALCLYDLTSAPGTWTARKNGQVQFTTTGNTVGFPATSLNFGLDSQGYGFNGDLAELVLFDHPLTDLARQEWATYLNAKYQYAPPPATPGQLAVEALSSTQVAVSWNETTQNVTGYTLERQNADGTWSVIANLGGNAGGYIDSGLAPGTTYSYRVTASNAYGSSPASASVTGTTGPSGGGAVQALPTDHLVLWFGGDQGITEDTSGNVSRWRDLSGQGNDALQSDASQRPQWVGGLLNGEPALHFNNAAALHLPDHLMDGAGAGEMLLVLRSTAPAGAYTGLMALGVGDGDWAPYSGDVFYEGFGSSQRYGPFQIPGDLTQFCLYDLSSSPGAWAARKNGSVEFATASNTVAFPTSNLSLGMNSQGYYFQGDIAEVLLFDHALTDDERQTWSSYLNGKYQYAPLPATPGQLEADALSSSQVAVSWNESIPNTTSYTLERQNADGSWSVIATLGGNVTSYVDGGLTAGTTYAYQVTASNAQGTSPVSGVIAGTTNAGGNTATGAFPTDGMRLWLRADAGVNVDANGNVNSWLDQSGNTTVSQSNPTRCPALVSAAVNGLPAVRFDGSNDEFDSSLLSAGGPGATFFVVTKGTQYQSLLRFQGTTGSYLIYPWYTNQQFIDSADGGIGGGISCGLISGQWNIGEATYQAGDRMATYCNGSLVASRPAANANLPGGVPFNLGFYAGGSEYLQADVAEVLIYDRALSDSERATVEEYLDAKYAVVTPPGAPASLSAIALSSTQVGLQWTAAAGASGYSVERKAGAAGAFEEVAAIAGGEVQAYIDHELTSGANYTYRLRAENLAGYSGYSNETSVTLAGVGSSETLPVDDLLLWLRSDAGVIQDASGTVTLVTDVSGHGNDASAPSGHAPSYQAASINGQPALHFDGGSSYLQLPGGFSDFTQGLTALVVTRPTSAASWSRLFDIGNGAGVDNLLLARNSGSNDLTYDGFTGGGLATSLTATGVLTQGTPELLEVNHSPMGTVTIYKNGVAAAQGGAGPINNVVRSSGFIGKSNWGSDALFQGDIAEVLMFNHALSDAERQTWEHYLNAKYNYDPVPTAPTQLLGTALSASQALISWVDTFAAISGYRVEEQNADGTWSVVATLGANTTGYLVTGLTPGSTYHFRVTATNETGDSPVTATALTTPASGDALPVGDLALWLCAADCPAGGVSVWPDMSGHANTATQTSSARFPQAVASVINGQPVVRFDGSSAQMLNLPDFLNGATAGDVFVVQQAIQPPSGQFGGFWRIGTAPSVAAEYPDGQGHIQDDFGSDASHDLGAPNQPINQPHLYEALSQPGEWTARVNGITQFSTPSNQVAWTATPSLGFGGHNYFDGYYSGDIAEVLVFAKALSQTERSTVEHYLLTKYNLCASPPVPPTGVSAYAVSPGQISVTWTAPLGNTAVDFLVEREEAGSGGAGFMQIAQLRNVLSYFDATAVAGTAYLYRVRALNAAGCSDYGPVVSVAPQASGVDVPLNTLRVWLRGDAAGAGLVGFWPDLSGRNNHASQSSTAQKPQANLDPATGTRMVHFDGDVLNLFDAMNGALEGEAVVVLRAGVNAAYPPNGLWRFGNADGFASAYPDGGGDISDDFGSTAVYGFSSGNDQAYTTLRIYDALSQPNYWAASIDATSVFSTGSNSVAWTNACKLGFGGQDYYGAFFSGDIAEVMVFEQALTAAQRQAVQRYLGLKYSVVGLLGGAAAADNDSDGLSNYQEYLDGTDPNDYYNGQAPQIAIYAGNNQSGTAGTVEAQPLQVIVTSAAGEPLVNAPVNFAVTRADGLLADPDEPGLFSSTVTVRSGAGGVASILFQAPTEGIFYTSLVTATAGTGSLVNHVTFAEAIAPDDDTSGDGLPDGWKQRYGFDLTVNNADADPDGDGLTNLQEYLLGTNPLVADYTSDGVPVSWLTALGFDPRYDSLDALDPDGQGLTYLQEYRLQQSTLDLWSFDEGTGTAVGSAQGYKDLGQLVNNPAWTADPDGGTALSFPTPSAFVDFAQPTDAHLDFPAPPASFSVSARFRTAATSGNTARLLGKGDLAQNGTPGYFLDLANGQVVFGVGSDGGTGTDLRVVTTAAYNDGQWHHAAAVFDQSAHQVSLYVDAVLQPVSVVNGSAGGSSGTSVDWSTVATLDAASPALDLTVGGNGADGSEQVWGAVDNVGLFDKALSAAEVTALAGSQANQAPAVALSSPLPGALFPEQGAISVQAQASSASAAIARVEFFSGGTKIGEADAAPYQLAWQAPVGTYNLTAKATDSRSATVLSKPVSITVSADSDQDGLPDAWELQYFGNLDQSASGSYLGDGISNLTKYLLGLDPTQPINTDSSAAAAIGLQVFTPLQ